MDARAYLRRIAYDGTVEPTLDTLNAIHYLHLLAVPFENLDIHRGVPIVLDEEPLFDKVVKRGRGGFCYELNSLFAGLLRALGFNVTILSGRVPRSEDDTGPEFDHMTLRVELEEAWLADVGFGECFLEPVRLVPDLESWQRDAYYGVDQAGERWRMLRASKRDARGIPAHKDDVRDWRMLYDFTLVPRAVADFAGMCQYHQTSPQSHFTRGRICSRLTESGRITLTEERLVVTDGGKRTETPITSSAQFSKTLDEQFGIRFEAVA